MARGSGLPFDLRINTPYEIYNGIYRHNVKTYEGANFVSDSFKGPKSYLGRYGDSFDRYLLRMKEMRESNSMMYKCINNMPSGAYSLFENRAADENTDMEMVISHFKYYFEAMKPILNIVYTATEAPKGEFGVSFVSDGTNCPYRCKFRAPGFYHLQGLPAMVKNSLLADLVTIIGTQDLVFGEIDK